MVEASLILTWRQPEAALEVALILTWRQPEAALEVAVQVTLIGEAGGGGDIGDRLAGFEQSAGLADTVRKLQRVGW